MRQEDVPKVMSRLASERKQLHWNKFIGSMVAMPFTIPFALVPVVPNIPFFYAAYRCWSHWRALKGSDHLDFILDHRLFRTVSPPELEEAYEEVAPDAPDFTFVTRNQVLDKTSPKEEMILAPESHTVLSKILGVPELSGEIERAVRQVQQRLEKEDSQQEQQQEQEQKTSTEEEKSSNEPKT